MGKAAEIVQTLREGRVREWVFDTEKGAAIPVPEEEPTKGQDEPAPQPTAIPAATYTYD